MDSSWTQFSQRVKSRWSALTRAVWISRKRKTDECRTLKHQVAELQRQIDHLQRQCQNERQTREALRDELRKRDAATPTTPATLSLPDDPPLPGHRYGPRLIALCVNLAQTIGLRTTAAALRIVFAWLGCDQRVPHWTSIRGWLLRLGVAALTTPVPKADDWVWMADHSNQIGPEKVLAVLAVRAAQWPAPGTPLTHADVRVLAVEPGTDWKRADMARAYERLAQQHGAPRAVLTDGAVELREGADILKTQRADSIVLGDFKHKAANILESVLERDPRFAPFQTQVGRTRCVIQQTELAHLVPPGVRPKARFMNLAPLLSWGAMMLWLLEHPEARGRRSITVERMDDKLGWLRGFAPDVARWAACQRVVSTGVTFINEQGLFRGAADRFAQRVAADRTCDASREVATRLEAFVRESEAKLGETERLPMSTEIVESSFGLYKQLERQHAKGGFTGLIAAFGALLRPATPEGVRDAFRRVVVKDVRAWIQQHVRETLTAKRQAAYREYRAALRGATREAAMT